MDRAGLIVHHLRGDCALTCRANQAHISTIKDYMARAAKSAAGLCFAAAQSLQSRFRFLKQCLLHSHKI
jgi:hypothetical protein